MPSNTEVGDVSQNVTIYTFPKLLLLLIVDIFDLFFHNELWHLPDIYILDFSETFLVSYWILPMGNLKYSCVYFPPTCRSLFKAF